METTFSVHRYDERDSLKRIRNSAEYRIIKESFLLSDEDAAALAVLRKISSIIVPTSSRTMDSDVAQSFIRDKLRFTSEELSAVMRDIASWTGSICFSDFIVPHWIRHILPDDPKPSFLSAQREDISEVGDYLEIDSSVVPLLRHIISSHSPMMLRLDGRKVLEDLYIFRNQIAGYGIPVFILDGTASEADEDDPISAALYAYHHNGIVLIPSTFSGYSEIQSNDIGKRLSLRWGGYKPDDEIDDEEDITSLPSVIEKRKLQDKGIIVIDTSLSYLTGERLKSAYRKTFSDGTDLLCSVTSEYGVPPVTVLKHRNLIDGILRKDDEDSLRQLLRTFSDRKSPRSVLLRSDRYDISIINTDIPISVIERMAKKAVTEKDSLRLIFTGGSGTGKTSYAQHIANSLGVPLHSIKAGRLFDTRFGESEKLIEKTFADAERSRAMLLIDEIDSIIARKTDITSAGAKTYNELTNCMLQELENYSGIFIGTTNYLSHLEPAFLRRVQKVVDFRYPDTTGIRKLLSMYFPSISFSEDDAEMLSAFEAIGPGDFASLSSLADYMEPEEITREFIIRNLSDTAAARNGKRTGPIGFR